MVNISFAILPTLVCILLYMLVYIYVHICIHIYLCIGQSHVYYTRILHTTENIPRIYTCFYGAHDFYELPYNAQSLAVLINLSAPPKS